VGLLAWIALGLIAGFLAQLIVPGQSRGGCLGIVLTCAIGLIGAAVGGFIGVQLGWGEVNEFDLRSIGLAALGAILVLLILNAVRGR
jgi:uncharacterized membrane protein YeaQ/YmgE (transglycosylase-associated protein family)